MHDQLINLINKLREAIQQDDFENVAYEIVVELELLPNAFDAIDPILSLMEENPYMDFGRQGALVHFAEKYYKNGYEEKLLLSLERRPAKHTLFMLNRIIKGSQGVTRRFYLDILDRIIVNPVLEEEIVSQAKAFKNLHK